MLLLTHIHTRTHAAQTPMASRNTTVDATARPTSRDFAHKTFIRATKIREDSCRKSGNAAALEKRARPSMVIRGAKAESLAERP